MASTVLATYDTVEQAHRAVNDAQEAGFARGDIGLAVNDASGEYKTHVDREDDNIDGEEGAGIGAGAGALFGALGGLIAITIPGVGPIIAAGPAAAALGALGGAGIGAVSGAVTGGITAALVDLGVSEEDANYYAESLRRGAALVAVSATEHDADRAREVLSKHDPIDIDQRIKQWRMREEWEGFDDGAEPYTAEEMSKQRYDDDVPTSDHDRRVRQYERS